MSAISDKSANYENTIESNLARESYLELDGDRRDETFAHTQELDWTPRSERNQVLKAQNF